MKIANIPDQALAVATRRLVSNGKLSETVITESIREEIAETERLLYMLRNGREPVAEQRNPFLTPAQAREKLADIQREVIATTKRHRMTKKEKEALASRQLQGRYIATVRQFKSAATRAKFAKMAKELGRENTIGLMRRELKTPGSVIEKRKRPDRRKSSAKVRANEPRRIARPAAPIRNAMTAAKVALMEAQKPGASNVTT